VKAIEGAAASIRLIARARRGCAATAPCCRASTRYLFERFEVRAAASFDGLMWPKNGECTLSDIFVAVVLSNNTEGIARRLSWTPHTRSLLPSQKRGRPPRHGRRVRAAAREYP
jgi:hypothetical protein